MATSHEYRGRLHWTGSAVRRDGKLQLVRNYRIDADGKPPLDGSAPAAFGGDDTRQNPETLLVASLVACHHLTYLALCERSNIEVVAYDDDAVGVLAFKDGRMRIVHTALRPQVNIADAAQLDQAIALHAAAHERCFIANSVNFAVDVEPTVTA